MQRRSLRQPWTRFLEVYHRSRASARRNRAAGPVFYAMDLHGRLCKASFAAVEATPARNQSAQFEEHQHAETFVKPDQFFRRAYSGAKPHQSRQYQALAAEIVCR